MAGVMTTVESRPASPCAISSMSSVPLAHEVRRRLVTPRSVVTSAWSVVWIAMPVHSTGALVRKFGLHEQQTRRSSARETGHAQNLAQLRSYRRRPHFGYLLTCPRTVAWRGSV